MLSRTYSSWVIFATIVLSFDGAMNVFIGFQHRKPRDPPLSSVNITTPPDNWFTQLLDHFQPTDTRTWKQRYQVSNELYKPGGPIFLMLGGEAELQEGMFSFAWADYAKKYNAMMFYLEHRYYGKSLPTSNLSVENLKYLSSEQALADAAYFVTAMNREHKLPPNTKWVAFGGSYPGNLAAWVRYKYPHLIHAAVASSAPVLAKVGDPWLKEIFGFMKESSDPKCASTIEAAYKQFDTLLKYATGQKIITDEHRLRGPMDSKIVNHVTNILHTLADYIQRESNDCDIMVGQTLDHLLRRTLGGDLSLYRYDDYNQSLKNANIDYHQWKYQVCTEFGYYPGPPGIKQCKDLFGERFTEQFVYRAVNCTNIVYGGLDLKATRVVYVHGSLDFWSTLGITKTRIPESPAIYIEGTTHCADLHTPRDDDPPALKDAREKISSLIGKWLQQEF